MPLSLTHKDSTNNVTYLSARVANPDGACGAEFGHLTLLVKMPAQIQGSHAFRFDRNGHEITLRHRASDGQWEAQYRFTLAPRSLSDFEAMCRTHQTTPDQLFTRARLCTLATPDGRVTLEGNRLIETHQGIRREENLESEAEVIGYLKEKFGVVIPSF